MAKKKLNQLDPATPTLTQLFGHANPSTGKMFRAQLSDIVALFTAQTPVKSYADEATLLANTNLVIGYLAYQVDEGLLYLYNGPTANDINNYTEIVGTEHFKGVYISDSALTSAVPSAEAGDYAYVDQGVDYPVALWVWDDDDNEWVASGSGGGAVDSVNGQTGVVVLDIENGLPAVDTTGTAISFAIPQIYGSVASPETGNITVVTTGLVKGMTQLLIHDNGTEPTYGGEIQIISGTYSTTVTNYIMLMAVSTTLILVTISQEV